MRKTWPALDVRFAVAMGEERAAAADRLAVALDDLRPTAVEEGDGAWRVFFGSTGDRDAAAHALAAEFLGMKCVYLEAGRGEEQAVPETIIGAVRKAVSIPILVGGGIRTPDEAKARVRAGASFIVTGNVLEKSGDGRLIRGFADAVHSAMKPSPAVKNGAEGGS